VKVFLAGRPAKIPVSTVIEAEKLSGRLSKNGVKKWKML
jgi:hypothetical protein